MKKILFMITILFLNGIQSAQAETGDSVSAFQVGEVSGTVTGKDGMPLPASSEFKSAWHDFGVLMVLKA